MPHAAIITRAAGPGTRACAPGPHLAAPDDLGATPPRLSLLRGGLAAVLLALPLCGVAGAGAAQNPTVTISSTSGPIDEGGWTTVRISLDRAATSGVYVPVRGRRADGSIYGQTAYVARGKTTGFVRIAHNDDAIWQPDGHYDMPVWLSPRLNYRGRYFFVGAGSRASDTTHAVRVTDNDPLTVSFARPLWVESEERSQNQAIIITISPPGQASLPVVNFSVAGTATEGTDYAFESTTVTRNGTVYTTSGAGLLNRGRAINLAFIDDTMDEGAETIILTLEPGNGYVLGENRQITVEIEDGERPAVTHTLALAASPATADEGDTGTADRTVTLSLTPASRNGNAVNYMACFTGSATKGGDYVLADQGNRDRLYLSLYLSTVEIPQNPGCYRVIVPLGATSGSFAVRVNGDTNIEDDETVTITLKRLSSPFFTDTPANYGVSATAGSVELVIRDDDGNAAPTVATALPDRTATVGRAFSYAFPAATFSDPDGDALTYTAAQGDGTALPSWLAFTAATRTFAGTPGSGDAGTVTVRVTATDSGGKTVTDDFDIVIGTTPPPVAAFHTAASRADEGAGTVSVRVDFSAAPSAPFTLHYTVSGTAESGDYSIAGSTSVVAGVTSVTIPVGLTDDTRDERDETVILTLADGTGYTVGSTRVHTLTIEDNDEPRPEQQVVRITAGAGPVTEGTDADFTVTRTGLALSPLTVRLAVTETGGGDFVAADSEGNTEVVMPAGSSSITVAVPTQDDSTDEADGTVSVTVRSGSGYHRHNRNHTAALALVDDDATEVRLSGSPDDIAENGGTKVLTVRLDRALVAPEVLTVPLVFSDRAKRGTDYTVTCGTAAGVTCHNLDAARPHLTFTGPAARQVTLTLTARDDGIDEGLGERVSAGLGTLDATSGEHLSGGAAARGTATFRIDDDDTTALTVAPVLAGAEFWEGDTLAVTVSGIPADYAAVTVTAAGSTAVRGTDYRLLRAGGTTLGGTDTLAPAGGTVTFTVQALADSTTEGNETITLRLDDPGGTLDTALGTLTLTDGARPGAGATVSKTALMLAEGGSAGRWTVALTRAPGTGQTVTVTAASSDGGAVQLAGPDGTQGTSATLSFTAADWNMPQTVTAHAQQDSDGTDETVTVTHTVAGPGDWQGGAAASVRVTVADAQRPAARVSITAGPAITEGGTATFTVTADPAAPSHGLGVLVQVTQDGAVVHQQLGQLGRRFVRIRPGASTARLFVRTEDDEMGEADGQVQARVMAQGSAYFPAFNADRAAVAVSDNDGGAVTLSVADATAQERNGSMDFTVTLSRAVTHPVLFRVRTRETDPVSAREGDTYRYDYRALDKEIRIWPGRTTATFWVRIWDDGHDEGAERFEVVLSEVRGADVADGVAVGTITNDDPLPAAFLSRFGHTVAEQALDGVAARLAPRRPPGLAVTVAGHPVGREGGGTALTATGPRAAGAAQRAMTEIARAIEDPAGRTGAARRAPESVDRDRALAGTAFTMTTAMDGTGGSTAFWGRAAVTGFDGQEGSFALDGRTVTLMLGADHTQGRWLAGLALLSSSGEGAYQDRDPRPHEADRAASQSCDDPAAVPCAGAVREGGGTTEATLTAVVPYAAVQASETLQLWTALGRGTGTVTLRPATGGTLVADTDWTMAAAGLRGTLAPHGPLLLAVTSDALWTRTESAGTDGLAASASDTTRLRLGVEAGWTVALDRGGTLAPRLALGLRHDGGDAATGFGVEVGGGVTWTDPGSGLVLGLDARTLLAHESDGRDGWGLALDLVWDPRPETRQGWSARLSRNYGGAATDGVAALLDPAAFPDAKASGEGAWSAEVAHGRALPGGRVGSPYALAARTPGTTGALRTGYRIGPDAEHAEDATLDLWAEPGPDGGVGAGLEWHW